MSWKLKGHLHVSGLDLITIGLATWRLSQALVYERGPFDLFLKLRERTGIEHNIFGERTLYSDKNVLSCIWCTSFWISLLFIFLPSPIRAAFAGSAIAIIVEENLMDKVEKVNNG